MSRLRPTTNLLLSLEYDILKNLVVGGTTCRLRQSVEEFTRRCRVIERFCNIIFINLMIFYVLGFADVASQLYILQNGLLWVWPSPSGGLEYV